VPEIDEKSGGERRPLKIAVVVSVALVCCIVFSGWLVKRYLFQREQNNVFNRRTACVGNLIQIRLGKERLAFDRQLTNGTPITFDDAMRVLNVNAYRCPEGGSYVINPIGVNPECTYTNVVWRRWRPPQRKPEMVPYYHRLD
jgi:hypothetical protein